MNQFPSEFASERRSILAILEQIDPICDRFESDFQGNDPPSIEAYLEAARPEIQGRLLQELLLIELEMRRRLERRSGQAKEYHARFPKFSMHVDEAFRIFESKRGTSETEVLGAPPGLDDETRSPDSLLGTKGEANAEAQKGAFDTNFGPYELVDEIARGGMGVVYKAIQMDIKRTVALKLILAGQFSRGDAVQRFQAEARAAAKLDHPGIVPIFDYGEVHGQPYYSMAYVDGENWERQIAGGLPTVQDAAQITLGVSQAVAHAHEHGVIHRDIKPGNILIGPEGEPRVTDFGLAKLMDEEDLTEPGQIMGTASYMPPEQAEGSVEKISTRSDVYSLGAVLYRMTTGRPPHIGKSYSETLVKVVSEEPAPPRRHNSKIPHDLQTIMLKCLHRDPQRRYATAQELADDLERYLGCRPIMARAVGPLERSWMWCRRRPVVALLSAVLILTVIFGSLFFVDQQFRNHGRGLISAAAEAEMERLPQLRHEIEDYSRWTRPELLQRLSDGDLGNEQRSKLQLIALPFDNTKIDGAVETLLDCEIVDFEPVRLCLTPFHQQVLSRMWEEAESSKSQRRRFRAALALTNWAPNDERWTPELRGVVLDGLFAEFSEKQPVVRKSIGEEFRNKLLDELDAVYRDGELEANKIAAVNALLDFRRDDSLALARLAMDATASHYSRIFPILKDGFNAEIRNYLEAIAQEDATSEIEVPERIRIGQRRAVAAITGVRMAELEITYLALAYKDDPESITQFVAGCKDYGATADQLVKALTSLAGEMRTADRPTSVAYALILALGEFQLEEVGEEVTQNQLLEQLAEWRVGHPSSRIHSASDWLLRRWKQHELLKRKIDPVKPGKEQEWLKVSITDNVSGDTRDLTFVVFQPGVYRIGGTRQELRHPTPDYAHSVRISRPFAVLDREITLGELRSLDPGVERRRVRSFYSPGHVAFAVSWYDSVKYCRWLTTAAGLAESDQAYPAPDSLDPAQHPNDGTGADSPKYWPVRVAKRGFRLPTNAEWEIACRGGAVTKFSFGSDESQLRRYAWTVRNSQERIQVGAQLRPNLRGLFDMIGNAHEWTHDAWFGAYPKTSFAIDPIERRRGSSRSVRGGGFLMYSPKRFLSAKRDRLRPGSFEPIVGFRVAFTLPSAWTEE